MGVSYIPVARVGELTPGVMKEVDLGGRQVILTFVEGNTSLSRVSALMKRRI